MLMGEKHEAEEVCPQFPEENIASLKLQAERSLESGHHSEKKKLCTRESMAESMFAHL